MCLFIIKYAPEKTVGKVSMNKGRVKYRSDNHGLTLIELIVTIGIIGIFIGVVSTFLSTTSNTYRGTSNNSKVQMETQETFDKLEDVIINANRNLAYGTSSRSVMILMEKMELAVLSAKYLWFPVERIQML